MRISNLSNDSLLIQANVNKKGDYELVCRVADQMVADSGGDFVVASECPYEQWVQICAKWEWEQAEDLRYCYKEAKRKVYSAK